MVPLADLPALLAALDPAAYLSLGLIVLIATPFVRVAGSSWRSRASATAATC